MFKKKIITGCESRGDADSPYLTRWTLFEFDSLGLMIHRFHRSDTDELHDHPWWFVSLILWRGYREHTPTGVKRYWPGSILLRPAMHAHRVELIDGKSAWTVVLRGGYRREWGFFTQKGWQWFREYFKERGC